MVKPESAAKFILAFLCIQSSPFVYAHGQGLFVMYIGVPTAALAFIISAIIVRCAYKSVKLWQYAILSLLFFLLWIPVYTIATFIAADFLDSAGILSHRYSEEPQLPVIAVELGSPIHPNYDETESNVVVPL